MWKRDKGALLVFNPFVVRVSWLDDLIPKYKVITSHSGIWKILCANRSMRFPLNLINKLNEQNSNLDHKFCKEKNKWNRDKFGRWTFNHASSVLIRFATKCLPNLLELPLDQFFVVSMITWSQVALLTSFLRYEAPAEGFERFDWTLCSFAKLFELCRDFSIPYVRAKVRWSHVCMIPTWLTNGGLHGTQFRRDSKPL